MKKETKHYLIYSFDDENCTLSFRLSSADNVSQALNDENCIKRVTMDYQEAFLCCLQIYEQKDFFTNIFDDVINNFTKGSEINNKISDILSNKIKEQNNILTEYINYIILEQHQVSRNAANNNLKILLFSFFMDVFNRIEKNEITKLKESVISFYGIEVFNLQNKKITIQNKICYDMGWCRIDNFKKYRIICNDITPFIIDFALHLIAKGYAINQCLCCNQYYISSNYAKIPLCNDTCQKRYYSKLSNQDKKKKIEKTNETRICYDFRDVWTKEIKKYSNFISEEQKEKFNQLAAKRSEELRNERDKISKHKKGNHNFYEMLTTFETERTNLLSPYMEELKNGEHKET